MPTYPTYARIWAAAVFICHATGFVHVGLMTNQFGKATLGYKYDFEHICATQGVKVKVYHADNGRFSARSFINDVKSCFQQIYPWATRY